MHLVKRLDVSLTIRKLLQCEEAKVSGYNTHLNEYDAASVFVEGSHSNFSGHPSAFNKCDYIVPIVSNRGRCLWATSLWTASLGGRGSLACPRSPRMGRRSCRWLSRRGRTRRAVIGRRTREHRGQRPSSHTASSGGKRTRIDGSELNNNSCMYNT